MNYRRLGHSGIKISELSFGAWVTFGDQINEKTAFALVHTAFDHGVNFFDNADSYAQGRAETVMGKAIQDIGRTELVLSSKVYWRTMPGPNGGGLSRKHLTESVQASLKRLGTDYLDLYFCHRYDPDTLIEEVVFTMNRFIQQGYILYWGTSEWTAEQVSEAHDIARENSLIPPTMEQPQYNMFHRARVEEELIPIIPEVGIGLTVWSPLASGILTGKYNEGIPEGSRMTHEGMDYLKDRLTDEKVGKVRELTEVAEELGCTTAQLAIAWLLRLPEVSSVITGATKVRQLEENLAAAEVVDKLDEGVLKRIEQILA